MIYLIGQAPSSLQYRSAHFEDFLDWLNRRKTYQLDVETNVTPHWCTKQLITLQFGDYWGEIQFVLQWSFLTPREKEQLKEVLERKDQLKLIHNALFECVVLLFHGIRIRNVYDTMVQEMVLYCGMQFNNENIEDEESEAVARFYALTSLCYRYTGRGMNKSEQLAFGDDVLTESKVIYAANDVKPLGAIYRMQLLELHAKDLEFVAALENEAVLAFAEMVWTGMPLDVNKWKENEELAIPVIQAAKIALDEYLNAQPFYEEALAKGYISSEDRLFINWNSFQQRDELMERFFPFLQGRTSKSVIDGMRKRRAKGEFDFSHEEAWTYVDACYDKNWKLLEDTMLLIDRQWLIDKEYLVPAGVSTINWNSWQQILPILCQHKKIQSTDAETMGRFGHPIAKALEKYRSALKLLSTYGMGFLKYVEPDGRVRTTFNQVVSTGRASSRKPNMQNIVVDESVGTRYRNAFVCGEDEVYVSSDFAMQELVIMTYMSGEPLWMDALRRNKDIHSICAELMFGKLWKEAAASDCAYYQSGEDSKPLQQKCSCKKHKVMRTKSKTVNFGVPYGMEKFKLAATLDITVQEAEALLLQHKRLFPKLWATITYLKHFGVRHGYIMTLAPFFRKRWFPYWYLSRSNIALHLSGQYDSNLGAIEREAGNQPIQGSGGDMMKLAMCMLYWELHDGPRDLSDLVRLAMTVHDQADTHCKKTYSAIWAKTMDRCMREAALFLIPNGLLGTDTTITPCWTK